jgi:glycosyltransferase involved in cell wall biosynthesis
MTADSNLPTVSVVIPTHNPRMDYLARVIDALREQTLDQSAWELVVVDNGSRVPLKAAPARQKDQETKSPKDAQSEQAAEIDLSWHPRAKIVREEAVGLTNARLRGFAETTGEVIVLVDDDNVLAADYLEEVVRIAQEHPFLGTWSGALELELEPGSPEPAPELRHLLCERRPTQDVWSNDRSNFAATPWGAGECIRREVAIAHAKKVENEPRRRQLDLQGEQLVYGGDTDIAYTGLELGLGMGVFTSLVITHLIPKERCRESYLLKHHEARAFSEVLHHWVEHGTIPRQRTDLRGRLGLLARRVLGNPLERKMIAARARGIHRGEQFVTRHS